MRELLLLLFPLFVVSCAKDETLPNNTEKEDLTIVTSYIALSSENAPRNTEASCLQLSDGTLFCAYTKFTGGTADNATAHIAGAYSYDGGRTWTDSNTIVYNFCDSNVMSVSLVEYKGAIHLYFLANNSDREGYLDLDINVIVSTDETCSWSNPVKINDTKGYWPVLNNSVLVTHNQCILIPVYHYQYHAMFTDKARNFVLYSDDGTDWSISNSICVEESKWGGLEPTLCELPSGNILMSIRTELGYQYFSVSYDGGKNFSSPYRSTLESTNSPTKMIVHNNELYAIHNSINSYSRNRLCISRSLDMGKTWDEIYVLQKSDVIKEATFAYPSAIIVNERLLISYWEYYPNSYGYSLKFCSIPIKLLVKNMYLVSE